MRALGASRTSLVPGGALAGGWARDPLWRNARAVPSLDLNFADNKSLVNGVTGQNLVTFTRASSGTFVGSDGLIKTAVTNLLLRSEEFQTTWATARASIAANDVVAPNGTTTADKLVEDSTASNSHYVAQDIAVTSGLTYTLSCFVKAAERFRFRINFLNTGFISNLSASFNLEDGTIVTTTDILATITNVGNGWYRCTATATATLTATTNFRLHLLSDTGSQNYNGDSTSGIYIWGAMLEQSSTVGEYIPTTSTINSAPRFDHNPTTGESLGLLVEEARTNLFLQSNAFTTTWGNTNVTLTSNSATSPAGVADGWLFANNTTTSNHNIGQGIAFTAAATTVSVFVKYLDHRWVGIRMGATGNQFFGSWDLQNGVVGSVTAGATIGMQAVGNGWYRLTLTATLTTAGSANCIFGLNNADAIALTSYAGTGTGIYIFGAQLEAGAFATSYIPTTSATVTRAADVASITGSNFSSFYNASAGTLFADYRTPASGTRGVAGFNDNTANERIELFTSSTDPKMLVVDGGTTQADLDGGTIVASTMTKTAVAYAVNDFSIVHAAGTAVTDTSGTLPTVNRLLIGADQAGNYQNGRIKRLTYWPTRLANTTLQQITQP